MFIREVAGEFAGNKDAAGRLREEKLKPAIAAKREILFNFDGVSGTTQSFIHALVSDAVKDDPCNLDLIAFSNCSEAVRSIIEVVVEYSQSRQVSNRQDSIPS